MTDIDATKAKYIDQINLADSLQTIEGIRVAALGKKGDVSLMMRGLGQMSPDEKKVMGPALNGLKTEIAALIETKKIQIENAEIDAALASETLDMSLPVARASGTELPARTPGTRYA